ncbi:MAG TPA: ATP-binding cassette domain-containing protein [Candidatus Babeliales bacterium]|jgi:putative ABC transport system ATP-binding protein|nr:ATP-binding cassette domain-containing protein [Candidatus Babeliales bacterium]
MIKFENVSITIDGKQILKNITCTINTGDFIVIVGPNGAGKSTLFDMISGKRIPTTGTILLDDTDITHLNEQQRATVISRLFQNPQLNGVASMTVAQNLALSNYKSKTVSLLNGITKFPTHLMTELDKLNLGSPKILNTPMKDLSGGQRQLLAFIMATILPPRLFMLDEPTAALDPQSATKLLQFAIKFINEHSLTTLLITHDPELALAIGTKIWVLENGQITKQFDTRDTVTLSASDLIGHIDYKKLMA